MARVISGKLKRRPMKAKKKKARMARRTKPIAEQRHLEAEILRRCAKGRDQLDKCMVPDVQIKQVDPGETGNAKFPRKWLRTEGSRRIVRGTAEWYIPPNANTSRRLLFLHGGSYVVYAPKDAVYRSLCSRLAVACGVCVLSIDYRMAPEHRFPAAYEDSVAALEWVAQHGPESSVVKRPASDLFVCGDSAGGGLALAVCVSPSKRVRSVLRGTIGLSAWLDLTASTPSYRTRQWDPEREYGDALNIGVDQQGGQDEAEEYLGPGGIKKHGKNWRASPFFAPAKRLAAMPSVLFHVGDYELILDESVFLHARMVKAGHVDATCRVYPRMWHCFHEYSEGGGTGRTLDVAVKATKEIGRWVSRRLSRS